MGVNAATEPLSCIVARRMAARAVGRIACDMPTSVITSRRLQRNVTRPVGWIVCPTTMASACVAGVYARAFRSADGRACSCRRMDHTDLHTNAYRTEQPDTPDTDARIHAKQARHQKYSQTRIECASIYKRQHARPCARTGACAQARLQRLSSRRALGRAQTLAGSNARRDPRRFRR
eukprot:6193838-Pleurochrysis_carterae.AAC.1